MENKFRTRNMDGNKPDTEGGSSRVIGQAAAWFTILLWGTTFVSIKILLEEFNPAEILLFRFIMGYCALFLACPRRLKTTGIRQEITFVLAGLSGVCLYYLLENIALTYTMASNVGVVVSVSPFFTAILFHFVRRRKKNSTASNDRKISSITSDEGTRSGTASDKETKSGTVSDKRRHEEDGEEKLQPSFFLGFLVAMTGIVMISFNGSQLKLNPAGDILSVIAAFSWACYSLLTRKISGYGYPVILTTRRAFFYGILFMLPSILLYDVEFRLERFSHPVYLFNFLYLGLGASALCFTTWNVAVKRLGPVKTSVYIYLVPVITVVTSALILKEPVNWITAVGTLLAIAGLFLSNFKSAKAT